MRVCRPNEQPVTREADSPATSSRGGGEGGGRSMRAVPRYRTAGGRPVSPHTHTRMTTGSGAPYPTDRRRPLQTSHVTGQRGHRITRSAGSHGVRGGHTGPGGSAGSHGVIRGQPRSHGVSRDPTGSAGSHGVHTGASRGHKRLAGGRNRGLHEVCQRPKQVRRVS